MQELHVSLRALKITTNLMRFALPPRVAGSEQAQILWLREQESGAEMKKPIHTLC